MNTFNIYRRVKNKGAFIKRALWPHLTLLSKGKMGDSTPAPPSLSSLNITYKSKKEHC